MINNLLLFYSLQLFGQTYEEIRTVKFQKNISAFSCDNAGNIFLGFADGGLSKYDSKGNLLENYAMPNASAVTFIDVQNPLKPFLFYPDNQEIVILDRFSSVPKRYHLSTFSIDLGMIACPAPDKDIWVVENNPQRIKKVNPQRNNLILELQMQLGDTLIQMQAFQNLLLIGTKNSLIALDQFGGELYKLSFDWLLNFQLLNREILITTSEGMFRHKLISGERLETIETPAYSLGAIAVADGLFSINKRSITLYKKP